MDWQQATEIYIFFNFYILLKNQHLNNNEQWFTKLLIIDIIHIMVTNLTINVNFLSSIFSSSLPPLSLDRYIIKFDCCSLDLMILVLLALWFRTMAISVPHITHVPEAFDFCSPIPSLCHLLTLTSFLSFTERQYLCHTCDSVRRMSHPRRPKKVIENIVM